MSDGSHRGPGGSGSLWALAADAASRLARRVRALPWHRLAAWVCALPGQSRDGARRVATFLGRAWRRWRSLSLGVRIAAIVVLAVVAVVATGLAAGTGQRWVALPPRGPDADLPPAVAALEAELAARVPDRTFVVVDQTHNRLYLWQDRQAVHEALCSAGSGVVLTDGPTGRKWVFDTPRGRFQILKKVRNPVWTKPDWAFIEEGKRPPRRASERIEKGVLGEYAMHLGDGYMIHGTLYERMLGRSVTHGCIRLGRDDLRRVYEAVEVGTPVFIF
ncbi:MAG TPA: L,D-transpeptidase [Myxococcota bacterium]|nr:L,D-transpeptidase [Myxococcota bacterium]